VAGQGKYRARDNKMYAMLADLQWSYFRDILSSLLCLAAPLPLLCRTHLLLARAIFKYGYRHRELLWISLVTMEGASRQCFKQVTAAWISIVVCIVAGVVLHPAISD
jgi:hypothetical protein